MSLIQIMTSITVKMGVVSQLSRLLIRGGGGGKGRSQKQGKLTHQYVHMSVASQNKLKKKNKMICGII